jgi:uncharacterized cupredoxin-like copper-binding protein
VAVLRRSSGSAPGLILGVVCAGLAVWALGPDAGPAEGGASPKPRPTPVVTVTLGRPAELGIVLSRSSRLPIGEIAFVVTNRGKVGHDFKLCTVPVATSDANACKGRATPVLGPGRTATMKVRLGGQGTYEFLCTVAGHAGAGMKGLLGVGVPVKAQPAPVAAAGAAPGPQPSAPATPPGAGSSNACPSPQSTTVSVNEFDFGFTLSRPSVPCGTVTFNMTNTGNASHDFAIGGNTSATIRTGQSTTMTADLGPGTYRYVCDVNGHDALGMLGTLTVTG